MTLVWLALSSIVWGAVLVGVGLAFQSLTRASGAERQWLWRSLALLLVLPWIAAPFAALLPKPDFSLPPMLPEFESQGVNLSVEAPLIGPANLSVGDIHPIPWGAVVAFIVVAGWGWRVLAARQSARTLAEIIARSIPARDGAALGFVRTWAQRLSMRRRPDLRLTEPFVSPFSYGAAKPVICLPEDIERNLEPAALDLVVGHECLHVARGDGWLRPIERLIADLMWFNPFAWIMRRQLDLARELACDEAVLDRCAAPNDYARVLRDVAGLVSGLDANTPVASMSLSGGGRNLILRVTRALHHAKRNPGRAVLAGMLLLALVGAPMAIAQALIVHGPDGGKIETSPDTQRPMLALIHAPMDAVVTVTRRSAGVSQGEFVILRATAGDDLHKGCVLGIDGLTDLRVANDARVKAGAPIGVKHPDSREIFGEPPAHTPCGMTAAQGYDWRGAPLPKGASTERLVASAYDGKVVFAGKTRDDGKVIEIAHGRDRQRYPHMSDVRVRVGQQVAAGEVIGARKPMTEAEAQQAALKYAVRVYQPDPPAPPAQPDALPSPVAPASSGGRVFHLWFPGRVETLHSGAGGYDMTIVQTEDSGDQHNCRFSATGFSSTPLHQGQTVARGAGLGWLGKHTTTEVRCEGKPTWNNFVDGQPRGPDYPAVPSAFAPEPPQAAPTAPAAPAAPAVEATPAAPAPPAPPAAPAPQATPIAPAHAVIRAPFDARVTTVASSKDLGLYVIIDQIGDPGGVGFGGADAHGCMVQAPHLSKASVKQGQSIRAGEVIGERANDDGNITAECKAFNADQVTGPTIAAPADHPSPTIALAHADKAVLDQPARLSSPYGYRVDPVTKMKVWHEGVDLASPLVAAVHTPVAGKVTFAGLKAGYGYVVEVAVADDYTLRFGHLGVLNVKQGDVATAGETVGTAGMGDRSTGPHVHLEVFWKGKGVDPQQVKGLTLIAVN